MIIFFLLISVVVIGIIKIVEIKRRKTIRKSLEKSLNQLIEENALVLQYIEYFRDRVIGIDSTKKKLLFVHYCRGVLDKNFIDLDSIVLCRINSSIDISTNKVREIFLELQHNDADKISKLVFFSRSIDNIKAKALLFRKAREWKGKIKRELATVNLNNSLEYL